MARQSQFHYSNDSGYKAISSQPVWVFKAAKPPGDHPVGAYFTTLGPDTNKLANRLRVPKSKIAFGFCFTDTGDLAPLPGGRGRYIFFSKDDYAVTEDRQLAHGAREAIAKELS